MGAVTLEGVVEQGQIKITSGSSLSERTKVYIVVPDVEIERTVHLHTPRLSHPEAAADFALEVTTAPSGSLSCIATCF